MSETIRIAVAGATGYTGVELLRLLRLHPLARVVRATSEQYAGKRLSEVYPSFHGEGDLFLEPLDPDGIGRDVDVVFSCLPHGAAAATVARALETCGRAIDLSADFRLRDASVFRQWYGEHPVPALLEGAVYGIPELSRQRLRGASLIAVPGCYPTGALLGLVPLGRAGAVGDGPIVVDSKSGATGAGRSAKTDLLFCEVDEGVRPYGVGSHRHTPELLQELAGAGVRNAVLFTPHLLPIRRGILSTMYVPLRPDVDLDGIYEAAYAGEPFIHRLGPGVFPDVRHVRGTNHVHLGWKEMPEAGTAIVVTAIDNLGKGAAGQAVQCFNVAFGLDETTGLGGLAAVP